MADDSAFISPARVNSRQVQQQGSIVPQQGGFSIPAALRALGVVAVDAFGNYVNANQEVIVAKGAEMAVKAGKGAARAIKNKFFPSPNGNPRGQRSGQRSNGGPRSSRPTGKGFSPNQTIEKDLTRGFPVVAGFTVFNQNSSGVMVSTPPDTSLYENPNIGQTLDDTSDTVYVRTQMKVINPKAFASSEAYTIFQDEIFGAFKQEVNSATNGGNTVTDTKFTVANLTLYIDTVWTMYTWLIELMSRQAYANHSSVNNKMLRRVAFMTTSDTSVLVLRNALGAALSSCYLTKGMRDYAQWLFQPYKSNAHDYSSETIFVSEEMANYIITKDPTYYKNVVSSYITSTFGSQVNLFGQISALLYAKTSASWTPLDTIPAPTNSSMFDDNFNDIINNAPIFVPSSDGTYYTAFPLPPSDTASTVPGAFENDVKNVQTHVLETFLQRWDIVPDSPVRTPSMFHWAAYNVQTDSTNYGYSNFLIWEDDTVGYGFNVKPIASTGTQIGNAITKIYPVDSTIVGSFAYNYFIMPTGNQCYLFDPAYNAVVYAQRRWLALLFS